jgi:hypothetical protein
MVIKDNEGDWGICVAVWRGMKKGKAGVPGNEKVMTLNFHVKCIPCIIRIVCSYQYTYIVILKIRKTRNKRNARS